MQHNTQHDGSETSKRSFFASRGNIVLIAFLAIAGFYLVTEHTAHLFGVLPYLLLLACPLMHIFMHGGHGRHGRPGSGGDANHSASDERNLPHQH